MIQGWPVVADMVKAGKRMLFMSGSDYGAAMCAIWHAAGVRPLTRITQEFHSLLQVRA